MYILRIYTSWKLEREQDQIASREIRQFGLAPFVGQRCHSSTHHAYVQQPTWAHNAIQATFRYSASLLIQI